MIPDFGLSLQERYAIIQQHKSEWNQKRYSLMIRFRVFSYVQAQKAMIEATLTELEACEKALDLLTGFERDLPGVES